ncbi:MAG: hydroxymethylpyrimidine/phosphomethylpyrimidine kinase [Rickettsiales bacterium]|nr:hydroxymethylpyrimidine/phosphomethylpyrimidine kinase [Rickettsiales bacterium]
MPYQILLIGGSDSSGLAGVQADKSICNHYYINPSIVTTSVTVQDNDNFYNRFDQDPGFIYDSICHILDNYEIDYVKIGMLANLNICEQVHKALINRTIKVIIDPVIRSSSGAKLLDDDALSFVKKNIIPMAYLITPNVIEAEILTDLTINDISSMKLACKLIKQTGVKNIVLKGGHLDDENFATDILYDESELFKLEQSLRCKSRLRGSGCKFASAVACNLILGNDLKKSFFISKKLITSFFFQEQNLAVN